MHFVIVCHCAR